MASHAILAEKAVSVSEARKNLSQYFTDEPVAVLSNNKPAGYMLSAELYEKMLRIIEASGAVEQGLFRPAAARLKEISRVSEELLLNADARLYRGWPEKYSCGFWLCCLVPRHLYGTDKTAVARAWRAGWQFQA